MARTRGVAVVGPARGSLAVNTAGGYDESLGSISPGLLLVDASVRTTFDEALEGYEFLGAAENWQERWAPVERPYRAVTLYPFSSRGLLGAGADAAQYFRRRPERRRSV